MWKYGKVNLKNVILELEVSMLLIFLFYFNDIFCLLLYRFIENGCYIFVLCKKKKKDRIINDIVICIVVFL